MSTNRFLQMAAAGADTAIPEEINACQCWSPCNTNNVVIAGNILAIPGSQYFVVQTVASCCHYLDYWCMDTSGNVCFKNRANASGQIPTYEKCWSPGGLAWDPIRNGVVETIWDTNCRPYANFHCRCQSCTCLHFSSGSQIGPTDANSQSLAGANSTFYDPCIDRFVTFYYSSGYIRQLTYQHFGGGNFSCNSNSCYTQYGVAPDYHGAHYDSTSNSFYNTWMCNSCKNCQKLTFTCICNDDGCGFSCTAGLRLNTDGRPFAGGHDPIRGVNLFASSDWTLDENSNNCYGALRLHVYESCCGCGYNHVNVCNYEDCAAALLGQNNGSAVVRGFMDSYSNNMILGYEYYNGSYLQSRVAQVVYGSGGYQETICLFHNQSNTRAWRGTQAGAHVTCAGWSVIGFGCNNSSGYFLRTFKPRVVS